MCLHMKAFHNKCLVRKWRWNKRREYDLQKFTFGRCEYAIIATYQNQIVSICICLLVLCIAWLLVRFLMSLICLQGEEVRLGIYLRKENARPCSAQAVLLVPDFVSALFLYFYVRLSRMAKAPHVVLCWIFVKHVRQCTSALKCENENEKPSYR